MKNGYKLGLAAIAASMALVGCGGGSTGSTPLGKAYYIDNAVGGVNYVCGSQEGITGPDGSFTFEVGSSCTFYLGDLKLRDVDAGLLVDGANVHETDVAIARVLQSLDTDGNPDNGITINADIVEALATAGITSLPTDTTEMDTMLSVIGQNGGTVVTELEAQEHLMSSLFSSIGASSGKSFYIVRDWNINQWIAYLQFNEFNIKYSDGTGFAGGMLWIEGDKLHESDGIYSMYYMVKEVTADYILLDSYVNGTLSTTEKFYFDEAKAQADLDSRTTPMTTAMLSGKVFYADNSTDFEMISFISSSEVIFREILLAQDGTISVDTGANAYPYTINASGDVVIDFGGGNTNTYKLIDATTTQWNMVKNGDATSPYSTWLLNAPSNFPVLDPVPTDPIPTAAEIESFVSGKDFWVDGITASYASDYSYSDNDNCSGTWAVSNNTLTVTGSCSYNITFNEALVDGMTVTLNITDTTPVQTVDVTFTEQTGTTGFTTPSVPSVYQITTAELTNRSISVGGETLMFNSNATGWDSGIGAFTWSINANYELVLVYPDLMLTITFSASPAEGSTVITVNGTNDYTITSYSAANWGSALSSYTFVHIYNNISTTTADFLKAPYVQLDSLALDLGASNALVRSCTDLGFTVNTYYNEATTDTGYGIVINKNYVSNDLTKFCSEEDYGGLDVVGGSIDLSISYN